MIAGCLACRGDIPLRAADLFMSKLNELEDAGKASPVIQDEGTSYIYVQHSNLYLLAITRTNVNATAILVFLHKLIEIFTHYFQALEEESLRDNFVIAYELLDEVMDFGYPQFTEAKILTEYIKTDAYKMAVQARPPMAVTNAVSWRTEGLVYKKNEVFLDVVESVNLLVNSNGTVVRSEVVGALKMRAYLSGMPECKVSQQGLGIWAGWPGLTTSYAGAAMCWQEQLGFDSAKLACGHVFCLMVCFVRGPPTTAGPQRQGPVRGPGAGGAAEGGGPGGHEVPPVRAAGQLRARPHHLFHTPWCVLLLVLLPLLPAPPWRAASAAASPQPARQDHSLTHPPTSRRRL